MRAIRCRCGKIICQVANVPELPKIEDVSEMPAGPAAVILCRHCKRYVILSIPGMSAISIASDVPEARKELVTT